MYVHLSPSLARLLALSLSLSLPVLVPVRMLTLQVEVSFAELNSDMART
jgi:hypothetical protein